MLALAVRQSTRQQPLHDQTRVSIPIWNDAAVRELMQDQTGPLFIASVHTTKLDTIATEKFHGAPDDIARLGFAIANHLDNSLPIVANASPETLTLAKKIADALSKARKPLIISGTSSGSQDIIKAAANISWALTTKNSETGIVLTLPECNSLGLAMIGSHSLSQAFAKIKKGDAYTAFILENDLYHHGKASEVDDFLISCKQLIVLDHTSTPTAQRANLVVPAGTFAESDGILVNNEGRAQRFFQVHEPGDSVQESWRWILNIGTATGNEIVSAWENFEDITHALSQEVEVLKNIEVVSPPPSYRINGQRVPREPHRFSGRTAMLANVNVSEPKPPEDPDSSLSYTMEGFRGLPPSTMIPFFWSPGWNSVQSINKYQQEIGGPLHGGDPGIRLLVPIQNQKTNYFGSMPAPFKPADGRLLMVYLHHIFGSEELSQHAPGIAERSPKVYALLHPEDAHKLKLEENQHIAFDIDGQSYRMPVKTSIELPRGVAGLPYGLQGLPFVDLPAFATFKND